MELKYNGWITLNKPAGISSFEPLRQIKKLIKVKIGHSGTLDPFATGVLPIGFGEATKLTSYIVNKKKIYEMDIVFGFETDSLDTDGKLINSSSSNIDLSAIKYILPNFIGEIKQTPPKFSAIKINGKRAYELARKEINFDISEKIVNIYNIELINFDNEKQTASLRVVCGSGTYMRSLARDIAYKLNSICYLSKLNRLSVGNFYLNDTISLDNLLNLVHNDKLKTYLQPIDIVLDDILAIYVDEIDSKKIKDGLRINIFENDSDLVKIICNNKLISIGKIENQCYKSVRVFNN